MLHLQLARMGYLDVVTLAETLEIANYGTYPALPLPPLTPPPEGALLALLMQGIQNAGPSVVGGGAFPQYTDPETQRTFIMDTASGQLLEVRVPITVIERLIAQQQLGIGQTVSASGRKSSGQESPKLESKSDEGGGSRQTVTESRK